MSLFGSYTEFFRIIPCLEGMYRIAPYIFWYYLEFVRITFLFRILNGILLYKSPRSQRSKKLIATKLKTNITVAKI